MQTEISISREFVKETWEWGINSVNMQASIVWRMTRDSSVDRLTIIIHNNSNWMIFVRTSKESFSYIVVRCNLSNFCLLRSPVLNWAILYSHNTYQNIKLDISISNSQSFSPRTIRNKIKPDTYHCMVVLLLLALVLNLKEHRDKIKQTEINQFGELYN